MFNFFQKKTDPLKDKSNYYVNGYEPKVGNTNPAKQASLNSSSVTQISQEDSLPSYYTPGKSIQQQEQMQSPVSLKQTLSSGNQYNSDYLEVAGNKSMLEETLHAGFEPSPLLNDQDFNESTYYQQQSVLDSQELTLQKQHYQKTLESLNPNLNIQSKPVYQTTRTLELESELDSNFSDQNNSNSSQVQALNFEQQELLEFLNILSITILGYSLDEIPQSKREYVINECSDIFSEYVTNFVESKYGKIEAIRLKAGQKFPQTNIFNQFTELGEIFDDAYESFKNFLLENWQNKLVLAN